MENKNEGLKLVVCFDDKAEQKAPITLENPTEEHLKELNEKGWGIFKTANSFFATPEQLKELAPKKGKKSVTKRNKEFLTKLNEIFADLDICKDSDGTTIEEREKRKENLRNALDKYCAPSVYVVTKNGLQPRWWLEETDISEAAQQKYVNITNGIIEWSKQNGAKGDPVKDVTRVLRKPGYYHQKSEPYLVTEKEGSGKTYTLEELREYFWHEPTVKMLSVTEKEKSSQIDSLDIRQVVIDVWKEKGNEAGFDRDDHLIIDGVVTATFRGRQGSGNYMATTSSDFPAKGNAVTYVAETLNITTKEAYKWLCQKYSINDSGEYAISIEAIEEMLKQIPVDTPKIKREEVIVPILQKLVWIKKITAETFITENIREYFGMTKEDAKKYIPHLNFLKSKEGKERKEAKEEKEKLPLISDRDIDFQEALDAVSEIGIVDRETLEIVTAVVISARLRLNPPLWMFIIAEPSSFKTELVELFNAMPEIYSLDTLTENAFASGYMPPDGSEPQDLLPLLDNKCFIIKDLNTLFSMNEEMVKKILGDLTSIFDGKFEKFTATRGLIKYKALFSMIGCITPSMMTRHYNYATQLGPRFFFLRLSKLTEEKMQAGFKKAWEDEDKRNRGEKIIRTRQLVSSYGAQLVKKIEKHKSSFESGEIKTKVENIAKFMSKARGIVISQSSKFENDSGKTINYNEVVDWQVEQPWRIFNQIKSLLRILSFIHGKNIIGDEEITSIKPIILSTMPVDRAEVLAVLASKSGAPAKEIALEAHKSTKTIQRTMKELETLGIVDCYKDPAYKNSGKAPWLYFVRPEFSSIINSPVPSPECLSLSKSNEVEENKSSLSDIITPVTGAVPSEEWAF